MKLVLTCAQLFLAFACFAAPEPVGAGPEHETTGITGSWPETTQEAKTASGAQGETETLLARAEKQFAAGSYALARGLYQQAAERELTPERRAWTEFRLADTRWRAAAQSNDPDSSEIDAALQDLTAQLARFTRPETRDALWAELHESLGDAAWRRQNQDWNGARTHYLEALGWWARSSDIETARKRYLGLVWKASLPEWREQSWGYSYFPTLLSLDVLANAVEIARGDADLARAHFLLGRAWIDQGQDRRAAQRVEGELGAVLELGKRSEWYDDALYALASFLESRGRLERDANGNLQPRPDFARALELYRRLVTEFKKGETRYWGECQGHIKQITEPTLTVDVDRFFLPGSEVAYSLSWRNQERIELELVPVELVRDVSFESPPSDDWLTRLTLARAPLARWTYDTAQADVRRYEPGRSSLSLAEKPGPGAYVLRARGITSEARALVLVSDVAVTVKASSSRVLAWATDVRTGAPIAGADLRLWESWNDGEWRRADEERKSGDDGIALFPTHGKNGNARYFVALASGPRQAFAEGWLPGRNDPRREWRIYAYTDRAAYRPGDAVCWRTWARTRSDGAYQTPAGETLDWEIRDPQGTLVREGSSTLDAFGATFGTLETTATMTLGEYQVHFKRKAKNEYLGAATLFRLEEYKLPEYEVRVKTPSDADGRPKLFRLGDRVEVEIEATYFYGAPVAGAAVEVFVHQRPRYRPVGKVREFPWFYDDAREAGWWGGPGQQIFHDSRTSDPAGKVTIAFDTPADARGEFEFVVQARVVDASRREINGQGTVVVADQGYRVELEAAHAIHRPGAAVEVTVRATDPNGNPVADDGRVTVTRERWVEVWRDANGRDVFGDALARAQAEPGFPEPRWTLRSQGYERETIAELDLATAADGNARFSFMPPRDGTYRIVWTSRDDREADITAETRVFVADESTRQLGYLPGGIEILVDQDTLEVGKTASVLLTTPQSGRWVLFTIEGEELLEHRVLHLDGQVKLVEIPITEAHVPNVFLGAVSTWGGQAYQDLEELIVPPVKQFLSVEVTPDQPEREPGTEGRFQVRVRDHAGQPVSAALSVAVVDEAVAYIQDDYAIDPRRFFYGEKRSLSVQTGGSFQQGRYDDLVRDEKGEVKDRRLAFGLEDRASGESDFSALRALGYGGGGEPAQERAGNRAQKLGRQAAPPASMAADAFALSKEEGSKRGGQGGGAPEPVVRVRSDFRATALWLPDVRTDAEGLAAVTVPFPDSTTRWKAAVRACDTGTRIGEGSASVRTRLPLIARLQAPRFFVAGDEVTISGNLDNNLAEPLTVDAALTVAGLELLGRVVDGKVVAGDVASLTIPAGGQVRVDWRVTVRAAGEARLKLAALGQEHGDAVERRLPVYPHGIEAHVDLAGKLEGSGPGELELALVLPKERGPDSTHLTLTLAPSLAVTMLDALPYLADYPYGCVEQTLSRFLPAVVVAKTLRERGLSVGDAMTRVFGGIEPGSADKTHPKGKQALERLDEMTRAGLERLYDFQHGDGGWAWWKDGDSNPFMSAYVLWGLALARDAGIDVRAGVLENAARYLAAELVVAESQPDLQAWMLHALAADAGAGRSDEARGFQAKALENLLAKRDSLNAYGRALLCLAAHAMGREAEARTLADNLRNGAILDRTPDTSVLVGGTHQPYTIPTAHFGQDGIYYRWSDGGVEATAFVLRALVAMDPKDELVAPLMNWLVKNRRGAQWSNTRDTAIAVLALNDYLAASGELGEPVEYELEVNGQTVATQRLEKDRLLAAPSVFTVDADRLRDGSNAIRITRKAGGPLYFAARADFFSLEEPIPPRGNEVFVRRDGYRLVARKTLLAGTVYERMPLADGDSLRSGERVEVVLTLEGKNDLEYLMIEDKKPAGLEAVQVRSGEPVSAQELKRSEAEARFGTGADAAAQEQRRRGTGRDVAVEARVGEGYTGRTRSAHQELRDRQVAFFLEKLPQGTWELRYELRAEVPGRYHAMPTMVQAMYVPEIHANGAELRIEVLDP